MITTTLKTRKKAAAAIACPAERALRAFAAEKRHHLALGPIGFDKSEEAEWNRRYDRLDACEEIAHGVIAQSEIGACFQLLLGIMWGEADASTWNWGMALRAYARLAGPYRNDPDLRVVERHIFKLYAPHIGNTEGGYNDTVEVSLEDYLAYTAPRKAA